jgi:hypothetical protein
MGKKPQEWFFAEKDKKHGPVSPLALKKLVDAGRVTRDTLVWREGMPDWVPAREIRGLCPDQPAMASAEAGPREETVDDPANGERSAIGHPLDWLVSGVRSAIPGSFVATTAKLAASVGVVVLYAAIASAIVGGAITAIKADSLKPLLSWCGLAAGLFVLQYVAVRLLSSIELMIAANNSRLGSTAVPDSTFAIVLLGTLAGAVGGLVAAVELGSLEAAFSALLWLAGGLFAACVAARPGDLGVVVDPGCRAAEEAVGVGTCLMKLFLRCVPLLFAVGVIFGTMEALTVIFKVFRAGDDRLRFMLVINDAWFVNSWLVGAAALPLVAYLVSLSYYLMLDVLSAIVSIPGKLDGLRRANDESVQAEP